MALHYRLVALAERQIQLRQLLMMLDSLRRTHDITPLYAYHYTLIV
jgi:hypothetical protein